MEKQVLTFATAPDLLTVLEASQLLRRCQHATYKAIRQGKIPAVRLGERKLLIPKAALMRLIAERGKRTNHVYSELYHGRIVEARNLIGVMWRERR